MSLQRTNWYEKYVNQGFTNEILRKDIPRGKRFIKVCKNFIQYF